MGECDSAVLFRSAVKIGTSAQALTEMSVVPVDSSLPPLSAPTIFAIRYLSAVAVAVLVYDHALTFADEVKLIWLNNLAGTGNRISFILSRYLTDAGLIYVAYMFSGTSRGLSHKVRVSLRSSSDEGIFTTNSCTNFIWVFGVVGSLATAAMQYIMVARVYVLWDRRRMIKWIVFVAFAIQAAFTTIFAILTAQKLQAVSGYDSRIHMCGISATPWTLPVTMATLVAFGLFIILMTIFNALDRPHQKQADVVTALVHDGARLFLVIFVLFFIQFVMTLVGNPGDALVTLAFVWAMLGIIPTRLQLRVEGLRVARLTLPSSISLADINFY
ncbi:hypothetical protein MSAN_02108900 [Mycena sanguinolenta]|uniref:DUF6533 domain-containing protein n=1 Tax=Mycena sanguinolenta TaxID=230812 RepID=A0A8H7CMK0_9AGAR|nr:hypothetical protein MSAN_02108900 [Mycena sanguinolenta]